MLARTETPLKRIMEAEGRSQSWLARSLGVKRQQVWNWCNGLHAPAQPTQVRIAEVLGRTVEEIFPVELEEAA